MRGTRNNRKIKSRKGGKIKGEERKKKERIKNVGRKVRSHEFGSSSEERK